MNNEKNTVAIHEAKNSDKIIRWAEIKQLNCSNRMQHKIAAAQENGLLWGCYLTPSGKIRATFI